MFSVKSDICKVVPVCATQAFRVVEVQLHTHTHNLSTTVNGHEWSASYQATPMSSEQEVGLEPELVWALWSKDKISSPARNQTKMPQLSYLWPTKSTMLSQL